MASNQRDIVFFQNETRHRPSLDSNLNTLTLAGDGSSVSRPPRPKYQVFISSTHLDLRESRAAVTWGILKAGHIPAGMESFPASDDRGWRTIQRSIDESDFYVLIMAGKYGSVDPDSGISFTEREYNYASEKNVPILAFVREATHVSGDMVETETGRTRKLKAFRRKVESAHLREPWTTDEDLVGRVANALGRAILDDEDNDTPRPGWYRGDTIPSAHVAEELAQLSTQSRQLMEENVQLREMMRGIAIRPPELRLMISSSYDENVRMLPLGRVHTIVEPVPTQPRAGNSPSTVAARIKAQWADTVQTWKRLNAEAKRGNETDWLILSIENQGEVHAKNVVVEVTGLSGVREFIRGEPPTFDVVRTTSFNMTRQRFEHDIGPGSVDVVHPIGLGGIPDSDGCMTFQLRIRVYSLAGVARDVTIEVISRVTERVVLSHTGDIKSREQVSSKQA